MANEPTIEGVKPNPLSGGQGNDATEHNKAVADKLAAQDVAANLLAKDVQPAADALDQLAEAHEKAAKEKEEGGGAPEVTPNAPVTPAPEVTPTETPEQKAAREKAEAEAKANEEFKKKADEIFKDSPSLAPNAAPKSHEAFTAVKVKAARDIAELTTRLETIAKENEELKKNTGKPTAEFEAQAKEIQTLREKLAKFDVEVDPKFQTYDASINKARDFIYEQFRRMPNVNEETIEAIKKLGGPEKLDLEKFFEGVKDPTTKRLVEAKVAEILTTDYDKQQAIKQTKNNIGEYLKERAGATQAQQETHYKAVSTELDQSLGKLDWLKPKEVTGTDAEKAAATEHNTFIESIKADISGALKDESPQLRAALLVGYAQFRNVSRLYAGLKAQSETDAKTIKDLTEKYEKLKRAGTSRLRESSAPAGGNPAATQKKDLFHAKAADSLDAIAQQVSDERNAKLGQGA